MNDILAKIGTIYTIFAGSLLSIIGLTVWVSTLRADVDNLRLDMPKGSIISIQKDVESLGERYIDLKQVMRELADVQRNNRDDIVRKIDDLGGILIRINKGDNK